MQKTRSFGLPLLSMLLALVLALPVRDALGGLAEKIGGGGKITVPSVPNADPTKEKGADAGVSSGSDDMKKYAEILEGSDEQAKAGALNDLYYMANRESIVTIFPHLEKMIAHKKDSVASRKGAARIFGRAHGIATSNAETMPDAARIKKEVEKYLPFFARSMMDNDVAAPLSGILMEYAEEDKKNTKEILDLLKKNNIKKEQNEHTGRVYTRCNYLLSE